MTKISLATYTLTVKEKKKKTAVEEEKKHLEDEKFLKLDNLNYSTLFQFQKGPQTVLGILEDLFTDKPVGYAKNEKAITINEYEIDDMRHMIYGTFYYGTYGSEQPVIDVNRENFEESKKIKIGKKDCPVTPYYFLIKIPVGREEGLMIFEKKGNSGIKTTFENWLKSYLQEKQLPLEFKIDPFTPENVILKFAEEGKVREIRYLSYSLPKEDIELLKDYNPNEGFYEIRFVFPSRIDKLKKVPEKLQKILSGKKDVEINDKMLGGADPDDIKIKVVLDKTPRTFTISNPTKAAPYRDVSMEITKGDDGHPDFESIHSIALDYSDEIFK